MKMYRFTLFGHLFILAMFYVDYNLAENRDEIIENLKIFVENWPEKREDDCLMVEVKENASENDTQSLTVYVIERIQGDSKKPDHKYFRFDFVKSDGSRVLSFYEFQIDVFVYYFEKNLQFILREEKATKTLSLDFSSAEDARHFYSKAATYGYFARGSLLNVTVDDDNAVVETYERGTGVKKSTSEVIYPNGIGIYFKVVDNTTTAFNFSTFLNDEDHTDVPILIFVSRQFNIGCQTMDKKVMLYLTDHDDTIFVVSFPSSEKANFFYEAIKEERFINPDNDNMLSVEEMQLYK